MPPFREKICIEVNTMKALFLVAAAVLAAAPVCFASNTAPAKTAATSEIRGWPPEDLSGRIDQVDVSQHLLIVSGDGTTFDFVVTPRTKIRQGSAHLSLGDLSAHKNVKIHFLPERRGDVAESIEVLN
jgi:hypothetical protein